jgi:dolichol-phosphate mannosyltransferase
MKPWVVENQQTESQDCYDIPPSTPHPSPRALLVAVPTYNEAENIEPLIQAVFDQIPLSAEILVIDDNSPDGTAAIVERLIQEYPKRLHILNRPEKQGLGKAYLAAFDWGLARGYDVFLEMDADFSHNPRYIPEMLEKIRTCDVVIGSRNIKGGAVEGWTALRTFISRGGSFYSRAVLGCPVMDLTGGFNLWTRAALLKIDLGKIISKGYSFQVEMKYRAYAAGCLTTEVPIIFFDRKLGKSKMSRKIFLEAFTVVWKIRKLAGGDTGMDQFFKFAITGGLGTVTNLVIFFICADKLSFPEVPVSLACFLTAASQNYVINHKWSFRKNTMRKNLSVKKWLLFICTSLFGLGVNLIVLIAVLSFFNPPYKFIAQAVGIMAGMVINFIFSKFLVFGGAKNEK